MSEPLAPHDTLEDLPDLRPYNTVAEVEGANVYKADLNQARSASPEDEADLLPSEPDPHDPQIAPPHVGREARHVATTKHEGYRNYAMIIGLVALMVVLGFIAYAIFGSRSAPANSTTDAASQGARTADAPAKPDASATLPAAPNTNATAPANRPAVGEPASPTVINKPNLTPTPDEPTEETTKVDTGRIKQQVSRTVYSAWQALETGSLNDHMSYYAPRLRTFYLKNDVDRSAARTEIAGAMRPYNSLKFDFSNMEVRVDPSGKSAIATYDKSWNFVGSQPWSGTVRERLWLVNSGGRWLINGVRDLKVY
jgi:hypothetical protein